MSEIDFYTDTVYDDIIAFDCGFDVFNDYILKRNDLAVVHYIIDAANDKVIAYFSLLSSALLFGDSCNLNAIPAIELKMFAIDKHYQKLGLAPRLLNTIKITIQSYASEYVGAKIILLYSVPVAKVIKLYKDAGFQKIEDSFAHSKSIFNDGCVPMFRQIRD